MKKFTWFVILIFSILGCDIQGGVITPPDKPKLVPEKVFWGGGAEGGVLVSISDKKSEDTYFGTIYFDANGDIWYQGRFKYTGYSPFDIGDKFSYTGWEGGYLFLSNGEKLIAVDMDQSSHDRDCAMVRHIGSDDGLDIIIKYLYFEWLAESGEKLRIFSRRLTSACATRCRINICYT